MKIFNKLFAFGAMVLISACDPIEDRDVLKNSYNPDEIELIATQTADGTGNGITLKMITPGVTGYWDTKLGKALTNEVSFITPFTGNVTFTYTVSSPYIPNGNFSEKEVITKEITVNVQVSDQPVPQAYKDLVGEDLQTKTWVFAKSEPLWWFMSNNNGTDYMGAWWNAAECCAPPDAGGKMVFDLDGSSNYTYYANAGGAATGSGSFSFNSDYKKLTIGGGENILGGEGTGANSCASPLSASAFGVYEIKELTSDRLVLYIQEAGDRNNTAPDACRSGWTWVFVPAP